MEIEQANLIPNRKNGWWDARLSLALFLLALAPRLVGLQTFVTADEAKWVYRSAQFWLALLHGDWAGTMVKLKPAVTTMWTGGLGLVAYNRLHQNLPLSDFLTAVPQWRVDPALLAAARLPTVLLSAVSVVFSAWLLRPLLGRRAAWFAGALLALEPLFLAHSRFLHHDALVTIFALPALLLAIHAARGSRRALVGSAILAGLAFLTKSPDFFLAPFVLGLFLWAGWRAGNLWGALRRCILWGAVSYLTFFLFWPAAWVSPVGAPLAVVLDALKEAAPKTDLEPFVNLGVLYYPVYFAFLASPVTLVGIIVWVLRRKQLSLPARFATDTLAWFALTFIIFMTFSDKRSARYILPAFVAATLVAGTGWHACLSRSRRKMQWAGLALALIAQLLAVVPYAPYYLTYTNPLLGGPLTAPRLVKIGWGEGMDLVGAWLNHQPDAAALVVGADYASTLTPFFAGKVVSPDSANLDYVVSYIKQRQGGSPSPRVQQYYARGVGAAKIVWLAGIDYARIYPGPAVQVVNTGALLAYRPQTNFAPIGQTWWVDLLWRGAPEMATFRLGNNAAQWTLNGVAMPLFSTDNLTVTRYALAIPAAVLPGDYTFSAGETVLGTAAVRYDRLPPGFTPAAALFGNEVRLLGDDVRVTPDNRQVTVRLAWQAAPKAWADYTVYVHLIDANGTRLAGHDAQPTPPTSRWLKGEVVLTVNPVPLPAGVQPDAVRVRVGLYRADTGDPLGDPVLLPDGIISK